MIDKHDVEKLKGNGLTITEMVNKLEGKDGEIIKENIENYQPNKEILKKLSIKGQGYLFVVFSADWCKDCKVNVAAFAKMLQIEPSINAVFFKGIKSAPLDPEVRWRVPPSPPEVNEFDLRKIPTFYVLDKNGKQVGEMIENPQIKPTLEEELLYILENIQG
ncbi:MAG: thioredoxin family protein [Candidatus Heimdallarchaeota archaeon]|nr:thioredoxin family protein [Candidatus Heimdallarchaeota archaeon]